jgi:hypothetical protein
MTAEEILKNYVDKDSVDELSINVWPDILFALEEYGKQQWNEAIEKATKEARVHYLPCGIVSECGCHGTCERPITSVDARTILKLKKP